MALDDELLACDASLADLWESGEPAPGHEDCPHCRDSLAELAQLDQAVHQALAVRDLPAPDLAARVMDLVRTELRPGRLVPLGDPAADDWITETAAARLFRQAADAVPGVVAGSCRITAAREPARYVLPGLPLPRVPLRVRIEVAIGLRRTVPGAAAAVRERVMNAAHAVIGLDVAVVDVSVVDVLDDDDEAAAGRPLNDATSGEG
ncbi:hypothetical protein [Streptomyces sp. CBMA29]|uniref:hypothetical protein n=1 Tax=Streptomyces sp. CBMA29 TaxID=1896314 RepID=UPI001662059E|nr:hypothetical protein [Streptomyces sp. CBMA29]MBD0735565.1 hypothetical protein [Streptomyces sp. CBMA29]